MCKNDADFIFFTGVLMRYLSGFVLSFVLVMGFFGSKSIACINTEDVEQFTGEQLTDEQFERIVNSPQNGCIAEDIRKRKSNGGLWGVKVDTQCGFLVPEVENVYLLRFENVLGTFLSPVVRLFGLFGADRVARFFPHPVPDRITHLMW
jgi:hypothetical protein